MSRYSGHSNDYGGNRPMLFALKNNSFNDYVGKRVRLVLRARHNRTHVYIGTFMAFDLDTNVVLADCYRVILYHTEYQRVEVKGMLLARGTQVMTVARERHERHLRRYPTPPFGSKKKSAKDQRRSKSSVSQDPAPNPVPALQLTPSRPLKLKRTWKSATPEPSPASFPVKLPRTPEPHQDTPFGTPTAAPDSVSDMVRGLKIKEEPAEEGMPEGVVVKEEPVDDPPVYYETAAAIVKEEVHMTFEEFLNTSDIDDGTSEGEITD